jgi:hypothetical protein
MNQIKNKKHTTKDVWNPDPGFGQAQKCDRNVLGTFIKESTLKISNFRLFKSLKIFGGYIAIYKFLKIFYDLQYTIPVLNYISHNTNKNVKGFMAGVI